MEEQILSLDDGINEEGTRVRPYGTPAVFYGPVYIDDPNGNPAFAVDGPSVFSTIVANSIIANTINLNSPFIPNLTVDNLTVEDSLTLAYLTSPGYFLLVGPDGFITSMAVVPG